MRRLQTVVVTSLLAIFLCHTALAQTSEQEMLVLAKQHLQNHHYSFATTWFERLLKTYPTSSHRKEVLLLMSQAYLAADREERAADALRTLLKENPEAAKTLDAKLLNLAKTAPKPVPQPVDTAAAAAAPEEKPIPIPIIEPVDDPPQEPLVEPGNIYAGTTIAANAKDVAGSSAETSSFEPEQNVAESAAAKKARTSPSLSVAPAAAIEPAAKARAAEPVPAARPERKAAAPTPAAAPPVPAAPTSEKTATGAPPPPATAAPAAAKPKVTASATTAAAPVAAPAGPAPRALPTPPASAPESRLSLPPVVPPRVPQPATPSAKAGKAGSGLYVLKLGADLLASQVPELKRKLENGGLLPTVLEGPKRKVPMVRLQVEGVMDQETARKKIEELRQAGVTGMILVGKNGQRRVYAGSFASEQKAGKEQRRLAALGFNCSLQKTVVPVPTYSVTAGSFPTRQAALEEEAKLERSGIKAVVIKLAR